MSSANSNNTLNMLHNIDDNNMETGESTLTFPKRKRKNEMTMEELLKLSAPSSKILNKMARKIGESMQQDWNALQSIGSGDGKS
ncbi:hypothetical protein CDL15_Pgr018606 [Punica granatum]|uniref:Uncharacterized protein n=1 Tax=Punica granatum TaxID=22663 RepID=A0A218WZ34_PUNGR|nr:hypothetical protein CDL15_Pgr018606 [Punica granatum]